MYKDQKGFAHLGVVLLLGVILVLGGAGWYVYSQNKVDSAEPNIVPENTSNNFKEETPGEGIEQKKVAGETNAPVTGTYRIADFAVSLELPEGWSGVRTVDSEYGNIDHTIKSPNTQISIGAAIASFPVGFPGCYEDSDLQPIFVDHISSTSIDDVVVIGTDQNGLLLAKASLEYGSLSRSLSAPMVKVGNMKQGQTYYYCMGQPPLGWSINFDGDNTNHDGIGASLPNRDTVVRPSTPGYYEVVKILESVKRL